MGRYDRNHTCITHEEQVKLAEAKVCVLGCGGLGGYSIEMLGRIGIGEIRVVDGDVFDESNLNRQLLADDRTLGKSKAISAFDRMKQVNPSVKVIPFYAYFKEDNSKEILDGVDLVVDALDNIASRKQAVEVCKSLNIPFIYGAIAGWYGQVATIMPGDQTMDILYNNDHGRGKEQVLGNPSFSPAAVASVQVSEAIKCLINRGELIRHGFLYMDLLNNDFEKIKF